MSELWISTRSIDDDTVRQALDPFSNYFITTNLYWECNCAHNYFRSSDMLLCENCGSFRDESPDARIGDLEDMGICENWYSSNIKQSYDQYNLNDRIFAEV